MIRPSLKLLCLLSLFSFVTGASEAQEKTLSAPPSAGTKKPLRKGIKKTDVGYATTIKKVPQDYPLPVPPGAELQLAHTVVADEGGTDYYVRFSAKHQAEELLDWYETSLKSGGWKTSKYEQKRGVMMTASKERGPRALLQFLNNPKGPGCVIITNVGRTR